MTAPSPPHATDRLAFLKTAAAILAVIAGAFALWALRHILTPFVLAIFLLLLIGGLEDALVKRARFPAKAALPAAIAVVVALFGASIWMIADNAGQMVRDGSLYAARLDVLLQMASDKLGLAAAPTINQLFHELGPGRYVSVVARVAGRVVEAAVFVLVYLGFMLASRRSARNKLVELFQEGHAEAVLVIGRIQQGVESYIWVQTVVGVIIAGASALLMWATGLSHVIFWAFLIFLANYIPVIGAAIGVLLPPFFGLVELDSVWKPVALLIGLEAVHFTVSHVVQPRMQGQRLNIDPIIVLLSLAFWGVVFGVAGAFLSTPLTVIVMAICAEFPATRAIAVLLSADGKPYANGFVTRKKVLTTKSTKDRTKKEG